MHYAGTGYFALVYTRPQLYRGMEILQNYECCFVLLFYPFFIEN